MILGIMANKGDSKKLITDETRDVLRKKLKLEYNFYYWIRARLFKQFVEVMEARNKLGEVTDAEVEDAKARYLEVQKDVVQEAVTFKDSGGTGPKNADEEEKEKKEKKKRK